MNIRQILSAQHFGDFWSIVREVDPQAVIREAEQPVRMVVCGMPGVGKRALATALANGGVVEGNVEIDVCDMNEAPVALPYSDLYIYVASGEKRLEAAHRSHLGQLLRRSAAVFLVVHGDDRVDSSARSLVRDDISASLGLPADRVICVSSFDRAVLEHEFMPPVVAIVPHLVVALGRQAAAFREPAAAYLIADTARANAEFALVSGLPSFIPIIGTIATTGADIVVLTKNQIMLLLKLALIYRRPIDNRIQVLMEIAPVVGAAFFWRSAARTLMALLPGPLAIGPRGAIAFVGTYIAGRTAQAYYRSGQRPSSEMMDRFQQEAIGQLQSVAPLLGRVGKYLRFP